MLTLPVGFFNCNGQSLSANNDLSLPPELMHQCVSFADWGSLARLACVQPKWSQILKEASNTSEASKWSLAKAMWDGTDGLAPNRDAALALWLELASIDVDDDGRPQAKQSKNWRSSIWVGPAMHKIAYYYFSDTRTAELGLAWLQASHTVGGDLEAAYEVAMVYEYGKYGIDIDVVKAFEWFRQAAEAGHIEAMAELGLCFELGCGVEQSDEHALDWYMKAADLGHLTAKYSVAEAYEEARGVPQSDHEACLWYYRAAVEGDEDSRQALLRLHDIARIVVPGVGSLLDV